MLNCCIRHKIAREQLQTQGGATCGSPRSADDVMSIGSSSDDEFFECEDDKKPASPNKKASKDELNRQVRADRKNEARSADSSQSCDLSSQSEGQEGETDVLTESRFF